MKRALCWASVLAGLFLAPAVAAPPATGDEPLRLLPQLLERDRSEGLRPTARGSRPTTGSAGRRRGDPPLSDARRTPLGRQPTKPLRTAGCRSCCWRPTKARSATSSRSGPRRCRRSRTGRRPSTGRPRVRISSTGSWSRRRTPVPRRPRASSGSACEDRRATPSAPRRSGRLPPAASQSRRLRDSLRADRRATRHGPRNRPKLWLDRTRRILARTGARRRGSRSPAARRPRPCWPPTSAS